MRDDKIKSGMAMGQTARRHDPQRDLTFSRPERGFSRAAIAMLRSVLPQAFGERIWEIFPRARAIWVGGRAADQQTVVKILEVLSEVQGGVIFWNKDDNTSNLNSIYETISSGNLEFNKNHDLSRGGSIIHIPKNAKCHDFKIENKEVNSFIIGDVYSFIDKIGIKGLASARSEFRGYKERKNIVAEVFELEKLRAGRGKGYSETGLETEKTALLDILNREQARLSRFPELLPVFLHHAVGKCLLAVAKGDFVGAQIALEVTIYWSERDTEPYRSEPWVKNPSLFVEHVYARWYDAGVLQRSHLNSDPLLYDAYRNHIKRHPADDLKLPTEPRTPIIDPVEHLKTKRLRDIQLKSTRGKAAPK